MPQNTDTAQTWRDLAELLQPGQVAYLENWDANPIPGLYDGRHEQATLRTAQEFIESNAAAVRFAHIPPPAEEGFHHPWTDQYDGTWTRDFVGTTREVDDIKITIGGIQDSDGSIERFISAHCECIDASTARQVAAALIAAADEIDRLAAQ